MKVIAQPMRSIDDQLWAVTFNWLWLRLPLSNCINSKFGQQEEDKLFPKLKNKMRAENINET